MSMLMRSVYVVLAGLYTLLSVAGLLAVWLAVSNGEPAAFVAFSSLTALSAAITGGALDGLKATYSH
jgi:hypothetical protein